MNKIMVWAICAFLPAYSYAQDSLKNSTKPLISGYADVYYKYNLNENASDNKTSFTNSQNSFELGMISVKIQHTFGRVSFTGDVGFGKRAEEFSYHDKSTSVAIKQLFISYRPVSWLKLTAGSFATFIGYELADANLNRNYSMSYLFSYGPFFHTGLKGEATLGNNTFMLGIFNPTDYKYAPLNSKKYFGAQWAYSPKEIPFTSYLNYMGGTDSGGIHNDQADLVMRYRFSPHFSLDYNGSYSHYTGNHTDAYWWGSALYLNVDFDDAWGLTLRTEYFSDKENMKVFTDKNSFPAGGNIWNFTLSANYKIGALTLIPELRLDHATVPLFTRNGKEVNNSPNLLVAAIYSF